MRLIIIWVCLLSLFLFSPAPAAQTGLKTYSNSIGMEFVLIPAGKFVMGGGKYAEHNERPGHTVIISKPFYLGQYEVTQAQWTAVMGHNPSRFKGQSNPVEEVSWEDVQVFIQRLNQKEGHSRYRLPTEAEWEYACRAGTTSVFSFGDKWFDNYDRYVWSEGTAHNTTHPVGQKQPNAWGLYDMHGNVWEWVQDWYDGATYYSRSPDSDPGGPASGTARVARGGSWQSSGRYSKSGSRYALEPDGYFNDALMKWGGDSVGFRLALSPE